jgi:hypothetical protein
MCITDVTVIPMKSFRAINQKSVKVCVGVYPYLDYQRQVWSDFALNQQISLLYFGITHYFRSQNMQFISSRGGFEVVHYRKGKGERKIIRYP